MKGRLLTCISFLGLTLSQNSFAATGLFFEVTTSDSNLTIRTTIPNHTYPAAGIRVNTTGYSLAASDSGCTPAGNGLCLFTVSDTAPATIKLSGPEGDVSVTICLNGQGPLSCQNYTAHLIPFTSTSYIFITPDAHNGDFGGVLGADAVCQAKAYEPGSLLPSGLQFKALLVSGSRFPCDATGACGGANAMDWPLFAGQLVKNPDNSPFNQVNSNSVFDGAVTTLMTPEGALDDTSFFWGGIQSILTNSTGTGIVAWAFADVNPASDSVEYFNNLATCTNWTSASGIDGGSVGKAGQDESVPQGSALANTWGNYYYFTNAQDAFLSNIWSYSSILSCNNSSLYKLVCVSN